MAEFNGLKGSRLRNSDTGNYMKNVVHSTSSGSKVWRRSIKSVRESTSSVVSSSPGRYLPETYSWSSGSKAKNHTLGRDWREYSNPAKRKLSCYENDNNRQRNLDNKVSQNINDILRQYNLSNQNIEGTKVPEETVEIVEEDIGLDDVHIDPIEEKIEIIEEIEYCNLKLGTGYVTHLTVPNVYPEVEKSVCGNSNDHTDQGNSECAREIGELCYWGSEDEEFLVLDYIGTCESEHASKADAELGEDVSARLLDYAGDVCISTENFSALSNLSTGDASSREREGHSSYESIETCNIDMLKHVDLRSNDELTPITMRMHQCIVQTILSNQEVLFTRYHITFRKYDLYTILGSGKLNDKVIEIYLSMIVRRSENNRDLPKVYSMSTYFFQNLLARGYASVAKWTKCIDLFTHDIVLIPVNIKNHWSLATIDFRVPGVFLYDSLGISPLNNFILSALLKYIEEEHLDKKKVKPCMMNFVKQQVDEMPLQDNGSDCGVFCCKAADHLSRKLPLNFIQEDMKYYRKRMVYEIMKDVLLEP